MLKDGVGGRNAGQATADHNRLRSREGFASTIACEAGKAPDLTAGCGYEIYNVSLRIELLFQYRILKLTFGHAHRTANSTAGWTDRSRGSRLRHVCGVQSLQDPLTLGV